MSLTDNDMKRLKAALKLDDLVKRDAKELGKSNVIGAYLFRVIEESEK
jgi:hypothetical protein